MMSGKVGTTAKKVVYAEGTFLWWGTFYVGTFYDYIYWAPEL